MIVLHRRVPGIRERIRTVGVVACMVLAAALLPACSSEDSSETAASVAASSTTVDSGQLAGTWVINAQPFTFRSDGTFEDEFMSGTYTFDGSVVTLDTDPDVVNECAGTTAQYTVTFIDADTVKMDVIDDPCQMRKGSTFGELTWSRAEQ